MTPASSIISSFSALQHRPLLVFTVAMSVGIALAAGAGAVAPWLTVVLVAIALSAIRIGASGQAAVVAGGNLASSAAVVAGGNLASSAAISAGSLLILLVAGALCGAIRYEAYRSIPRDDVSRWAAQPHTAVLSGALETDPEQLPGRTTFVMSVQSVQSGLDPETSASGLAYVTVLDMGRGAEEAGSLGYGARISLRGRLEVPAPPTNPGAFSWRDYLARRGIYCSVLVKRPRNATVLQAPPPMAAAVALHRLRTAMVRSIHAALPPTRAAILEGVLIGRRVQLPPDLMADFVHTGTVHILASAGLHVGILAGCLFLGARLLTLPRKLACAIVIALLWAYVVIASERPSVVRAVLMVTLYLGAIIFEREPDVPTSIAAAALVLLALQPAQLFDAGFELSFLTVSTLALAMPVWDAFWRPRIAGIAANRLTKRAILRGLELVGLSFFAQIGSMPVIATAYSETSVSGVAANVLVVPWLFLIVPLGMAGALFGAIAPWIGEPFYVLVSPLVGLVEVIVRRFGESALGYRAVQPPSALDAVVYYFVVATLLTVAAVRLRPVSQPVDVDD